MEGIIEELKSSLGVQRFSLFSFQWIGSSRDGRQEQEIGLESKDENHEFTLDSCASEFDFTPTTTTNAFAVPSFHHFQSPTSNFPQANDKHKMNQESYENGGGISVATASNISFMNGSQNGHCSQRLRVDEFYQTVIGDTKMLILKRYKSLKPVGSGAQGVVW